MQKEGDDVSGNFFQLCYYFGVVHNVLRNFAQFCRAFANVCELLHVLVYFLHVALVPICQTQSCISAILKLFETLVETHLE